MDKLHVTQDDHGLWMLSLEREDGSLVLLAHQFTTSDKPLEVANELIEEGKVRATILVDPPRPDTATRRTAVPDDYTKPAPRKAGA